jgi:hypothetical protein
VYNGCGDAIGSVAVPTPCGDIVWAFPSVADCRVRLAVVYRMDIISPMVGVGGWTVSILKSRCEQSSSGRKRHHSQALLSSYGLSLQQSPG